MRRPSPSLVVSVVALLLAISGAAFAGGYVITSVKQIKPSVRKTLKGHRGPRGLQGPQGPPGSPGPAGRFTTSNVALVRGATATMCAETGTPQPCQVGTSIATCPTGSVALGGGWDGLKTPPLDATVAYNYGADASWGVIMVNHASTSASFQAVATCASGNATARAASRTAGVRRIAREKARVVAGLTP